MPSRPLPGSSVAKPPPRESGIMTCRVRGRRRAATDEVALVLDVLLIGAEMDDLGQGRVGLAVVVVAQEEHDRGLDLVAEVVRVPRQLRVALRALRGQRGCRFARRTNVRLTPGDDS